MQKVCYQGCINVAFGGSNQSYIIVRGVDEAYSRQLYYRSLFDNFGGHDFVAEIENFFTTYIVPESSVDEYITLLV
jgi:hypothetical protein